MNATPAKRDSAGKAPDSVGALLDVSTITGLLGKKWEPSALLIMPQRGTTA